MKIISYYKISRPVNILLGAISIMLTASFFIQFPQWTVIVPAMFVVMSLNAAANAINDIYDIDIDKINRPERPLPLGKLSVKEAGWFSLILFIAGNSVSFQLGWLPFIISAGIATPLMIFYSAYLKRTPLWGNSLIAFILGLTFIYGASAFGDYRIGIVPGILAFLYTIIRELIKDMEDMDGDKKENLKTLPLLIGLKPSLYVTMGLIIILLVFLPLPFILGIYGKYYLWLVMLTVHLPLVYLLFAIAFSKKHNFSAYAGFLKLDIFFGLFSIYMGKF